ncbi:MAG: DUF4293 domain-containing protein [Bacteroidota bacterium]|nr:DUF4293 domain-containing protein [Bacteroidota bacterium]MDP4275130.1 DUF4293 domain-containing protein [Bacteroidota bacterium]
MIQRIQTLYLLAAFVLLLILPLFPFAAIIQSGSVLYSFKLFGLYILTHNSPRLIYTFWPLLILWLALGISYLATIFMFKKRIVQMRLCLLNCLFVLIFDVLMYFSGKQFISQLSLNVNYFWWLFFIPFLIIVLTYIAYKAIKKDEDLIRSVDRIR